MKRLLCIVLLLGFVSGARGENPKEALKGVKQEIDAKKQLITKTRKVEAVISTELSEIRHSLDQKVADLGKLNRDLQQVESTLDRTGQDIARVTAEASQKKQEIERRLVSLYKAGELGALRMFFSAESFPQMVENMRYMNSILEHDKKIFSDYNGKIDELRRLKSNLERDAAKKAHIKDGIASKKREIEQEKSRKAAYLQKVRQDRAGYEKSLKELQANASRLQAMLNRLEALSRRKLAPRQEKPGTKSKPLPELPPVPDRGFASQKGRMSLPVRGEVVETYGKHKHPEFNSYTFSKGLSIAAGMGSDIRSIYDGNVIFADYFKGYGNMVIVDHGGGYFSLYAHAGKILKKIGADVAKNEAVATVGDTDSTRGPLLYFEIRHQGKPVDPAGWVR
ncbi:murein hydrolase activator EnvC [Geobacter sp. SVR]|uniref:murein hydrolase activator EnvC family protein n=1 Tax=Geobacter sp. SVR TaxID=2495594 RepID=UPI00143EF501|nr:peptidoglycan DD-metalloendopeptidase family protein [Geobacter sp. SVR]BCS53674.1 peptidase M23 [Geobacter sp. SVR]GCF84129.1 peptidase M23 [Geobacter sp. SVR]